MDHCPKQFIIWLNEADPPVLDFPLLDSEVKYVKRDGSIGWKRDLKAGKWRRRCQYEVSVKSVPGKCRLRCKYQDSRYKGSIYQASAAFTAITRSGESQ